MKKILLSLGFFALAISGAYAQVGIGTLMPDKSAQLDITATDKGVLIPRITLTSTTQKLGSVDNAKSLLIFSGQFTENGTTYPEGYYYWDGAKWVAIISDTEAGLKTLLKHLGSTTGGSVTYNSTNHTFNVNAENGIKVHDGKVKLGGPLTENTTINLDGKTFGLEGLIEQNGVNGYNLVVIDNNNNIKKIAKLSAKDIVGSNGTAGQVVGSNGDGTLKWVDLPASVSPSTLDTDGDISGKLNSVTVNKIKNQAVTAGTTDGQVLVFNGTAWVPGKLEAKSLDLSKINLAGDVTGPLNATSVGKLKGQELDVTGASNGKILTYDGTKWVAKDPATVNANNLDGKQNLTVGNGLEFPTGTNGNEAVLKAVTINVKASDGIKLGNDGISVDVKDKSGLILDGTSPNKKLAVSAGNGLTVDASTGKVGLGGTLEKDTEIITDTGKGLTIKGENGKNANVTIAGLEEKTTLEPNKDRIIVVGNNGKLTKVDPNLIGKTNYETNKEVDTGKKWTDNKKVYQKVFDVNFNSATYAKAGDNIPDGATIIGIRLVGQEKQEVFSSARYVKDYKLDPVNKPTETTKLIFAVYGGMAWTLNGAYTVIVEYAR